MLVFSSEKHIPHNQNISKFWHRDSNTDFHNATNFPMHHHRCLQIYLWIPVLSTILQTRLSNSSPAETEFTNIHIIQNLVYSILLSYKSIHFIQTEPDINQLKDPTFLKNRSAQHKILHNYSCCKSSTITHIHRIK